jgi:tetratricopeptide (TPR) repeat protein
MLETIREYARERLDEAVEAAECTVRHARWYLEQLRANYPDRLGARHPEILAWYDDEQDNLRAMLDRLSDAAPIDAARAAYMLHFFWRARGAVAEEQERLRALLARDDLPQQSRAGLLVRLSDVDMHVGRVDASEVAAREALALAEPGTESHYLALACLAFSSIHRGEAEEALLLGRQAAEVAELLDDASRIQAMGNLVSILAGLKRVNEARALLERFIHEARRSGLTALETLGLTDLGELALVEHDYESARAAYVALLTQLRRSASKYYEMESLRGLGLASLGLGQRAEARAAFSEMLELALAATQTHSRYVAGALSGIALGAEPNDADRAARLRGAVAQLSSDAGVVMNAYSEADAEIERHFERELVAMLGEEAWKQEKAAGSTMTLEEAIAVARFICDGAEVAASADS